MSREEKQQTQQAELETYAELFLNHFKHYFNENNDEYLHSEIYVSDNFIGLNFKIDENAPSKLIEFKEDTEIINLFGNLSIIEENTLYVQKDIKGFTENSFYVIKSNEYKNWHPAIARLDIVEFIGLSNSKPVPSVFCTVTILKLQFLYKFIANPLPNPLYVSDFAFAPSILKFSKSAFSR